MLPIEVVIPVRNMRAHLEACLETLTTQLGPDDRITVVDDGSSDGGADTARAAGAHVIGVSEHSGPYVARHLGVMASNRPLILFADARCRAKPGLIESH